MTHDAPTRIPEGRFEKAKFFVEMARRERSANRLQSAENFLRLAVAMNPIDPAIGTELQAVVRQRSTARAA